MPEFTKLWSRPSEAILVWPGEEPLQISYDAETILVPPRFETAKVGPGSPYRFPSATDKSSHLVRGTVLVKDRTVSSAEGGWKTVFSVNDMAAYLTRDRDDLFRRGFNIVADVSQVDTAMELGIPLYEASQDERARDIVAKEMDRRHKYEQKGQPAPPSSSDHLVAWAIAHLRSREPKRPQFSTDQLRTALEGHYDAAVSPATIPLEQPRTGMELYQDAKDLKVQLSKAELEALFENNEDQMRFVREKIAARRSALLQRRLEQEAEQHAAEGEGEASD
jgi:hypothetical protein